MNNMPLASMTKRLYTVPETAELLNVSEKLIWKMISMRKGLDVVRLGRSVRISAESIDALIEDGTTPALPCKTHSSNARFRMIANRERQKKPA